MAVLELIGIGDDVGFVLPTDMLARLSPKEGDTLVAVEVRGGIELMATSPEFESQMTVAR